MSTGDWIATVFLLAPVTLYLLALACVWVWDVIADIRRKDQP